MDFSGPDRFCDSCGAGLGYPALKSAFDRVTSVSEPSASTAVGSVVSLGGGAMGLITGSQGPWYNQCVGWGGSSYKVTPYGYINVGVQAGTGECEYTAYKILYYSDYTGPTETREPTLPEVVSRLSSAGADTDVKTAYQAELDAMMQDPDYVPTFTDDTTGLPYAPPAQSEVMTPSQLTAYNANGVAREAAQAAAASAAQAATNAGNAYVASGGDLATGVGGDPALYQKYLDAKALADAAAADAARYESDSQDTSSFTGTFSDSVGYGDSTQDFNFGARFQSFFDSMRQTSLFSLPNQVLGGIPSGGESSMTFSGGRFGQFNFDFAQYSTLFLTIKAILVVIFGWYSVRIVLLKGGGS